MSTQRAPSSVVEHVTFNHGVPGSIPGGPTNKIRGFCDREPGETSWWDRIGTGLTSALLSRAS